MNSRESIYAALFSLVSGAAGFTTTSRRLQHIESVQPFQFPCLYQHQIVESWSQPVGNLPPIGILQVELWVYVYSADETVSHSVQLNPLVDALVAALKLPPTPTQFGKQDLGGLIESVTLNGSISYAEGALADRGIAHIPLNIRLVG
jgi:hypothetical protein